jgi:hypothetical protein
VGSIAAAVAFSMVHWSNTSHFHEAKIRYNEKAQVVANPVRRPFGRAKREGVLQVAAAFVNTAVRRKHIERSFDLATPNLRSGYTRHTWATQDIPVQPYPLDFAKYRLKGSFTDSVWLQVALFPDKAHRATVPAAVFDITLKPVVHAGHRTWLVDSWAPAGYQGVPSGPLGGVRDAKGRPVPTAVTYGAPLKSRWWLLVPISGFLGGLLVVIFFAVRGWWRGARALKRYRATYR